jgi:hypothetical protein
MLSRALVCLTAFLAATGAAIASVEEDTAIYRSLSTAHPELVQQPVTLSAEGEPVGLTLAQFAGCLAARWSPETATFEDGFFGDTLAFSGIAYPNADAPLDIAFGLEEDDGRMVITDVTFAGKTRSTLAEKRTMLALFVPDCR